jgi:hypothetical protein
MRKNYIQLETVDNKKSFSYVYDHAGPKPVAARSKAWICGRSFVRIVGSNPDGDMEVLLLEVLCVFR